MTRDTEAQKTEVFNHLVKHGGRQEYWMWDILTESGVSEVVGRWWKTQ
jgi:hypothetical protein